jgi:hypothetical protein
MITTRGGQTSFFFGADVTGVVTTIKNDTFLKRILYIIGGN